MTEIMDSIEAHFLSEIAEGIKNGDYPTNDVLANCLRCDRIQIPIEILAHTADRLEGTVQPNLKRGRRKNHHRIHHLLMRNLYKHKKLELKELGKKHNKEETIESLAEELGMKYNEIDKLVYPRKNSANNS